MKDTEPSPTAGMNIAQRILHVGGRENAAGYIEFGSVAAVRALVGQVLRDRMDTRFIRERVREILNGIDKAECDHADGWWETREGAEQGAKALSELEALLFGSTPLVAGVLNDLVQAFDEWELTLPQDARAAFRAVYDAAHAALHAAPAPQAVPAEHVGTVEGNDTFREMRWNPNVAAFSFEPGTKLYAAPAAPAADAGAARWIEIGKAVERACKELPHGYEIAIQIEKDAGTVTLIDEDGNEHQDFCHDDGFGGVMNQAIDTAIAAQAAGKGE